MCFHWVEKYQLSTPKKIRKRKYQAKDVWFETFMPSKKQGIKVIKLKHFYVSLERRKFAYQNSAPCFSSLERPK